MGPPQGSARPGPVSGAWRTNQLTLRNERVAFEHYIMLHGVVFISEEEIDADASRWDVAVSLEGVYGFRVGDRYSSSCFY